MQDSPLDGLKEEAAGDFNGSKSNYSRSILLVLVPENAASYSTVNLSNEK